MTINTIIKTASPRQCIRVRDIDVDIVRKQIENLHLGVYPPDGRVRVAAPTDTQDDAIRLAIVAKLAWIRRRQQAFAGQSRQSRREYITGESHYVAGRRYLLDLVEKEQAPTVELRNNTALVLTVRPGSTRARREAVMQKWYRQRLLEAIPALRDRWQPLIGATPSEVRIKKMKTRWGSCSIASKRIWLNLELAKKPAECLEYIFVHEMVHLLERQHNERFRRLMDAFMPQWRLNRDVLNRALLSHNEWRY